MSVRIVAKLHPLRDKLERWTEEAGSTVADVLAKINPKLLRHPISVQINGVPMNEPDWLIDLFDGDLVNIRVGFAGGKGGLGVVGAGLGIGGLLLAKMLSKNKASSSAGQAATQNNTLSPPPEPAPNPTPVPVANFGGYKDTVIPQITGVSNQANPYGAVPRVYGTFRMNPVIVAEPYYTVHGGHQYLYAVFSCGYGRLDISDIKIGLVPITAFQSAGVLTYEVLSGVLPDSEAVSIYTNDVSPATVGAQLEYNVPQIVLASQQSDTLSVDITFPDGLYGVDRPTREPDDIQGVTFTGEYPATDLYKNVQVTCSFDIKYRLAGSGAGWTTRALTTASTNQTGVFRISDTWSVTHGLYEVQITKTSNNDLIEYDEHFDAVPIGNGVAIGANTVHHMVTPVNTATWGSLKAIKNQAPINRKKDRNGANIPMTYIAVKVRASSLINGTLENLSCLAKSYLRAWNGSSWDAPAITANPAWVFADMITGTINNKDLDDSYLDPDNLKDWADFCTLQGLTYNDVIDDFTSLPELLKRVATVGKASINVVDGLIGVVCDKERSTVVSMITASNSDAISFHQGKPKIPHAIRVNFINPDADWNQDERIVYADGYTSNNADIFETYDFRGVTNPTQAYRLARHQLAVAQLRPCTYTVKMDWAHLLFNRGDLVYLNYDVPLFGLSSALINDTIDNGVNMTGLELSQEVYFDATMSYGLKIQLIDGTVTSHNLTNPGTGYTSTVTFNTPISLAGSPLPERDNQVAFGFYNSEVGECLVNEIHHDAGDRSATVVLVDYSPDIFDADTEIVPPYTPNVSIQHPSRRTIEAPVVDAIISDETALIKNSDGSLVSRIMVSLAPPTFTFTADIQAQIRLNGEETFHPGGSAPVDGSNVVFIPGVQDREVYDVRLKYVETNTGVSSDWTTILGHTVVGKTTPPPDITSIRLQGQTAIVRYDLEAGIGVPLDFAGYEARWSMGTFAVWENMTILEELSVSPLFDLSKLPLGPLVFAVKAVDSSGNRSANAAFLFRNVNDDFLENQIQEELFSPDWGGTKTNCSVVGNDLLADADATDIFYGPGGDAFYKSDPDSLFYEDGYLSMQYSEEFVPPYAAEGDYKIFLITEDADGNSLIDASSYLCQYSQGNQALFYDQDPTAPMYGASSDLFYGAEPTPVWHPFPQEGIEGSREPLTTRITCTAVLGQRPQLLEGVGLRMDVPDVEEDVQQIIDANAGAGEALVLTKSYRQIGDVQLTILANASYPTAVYATVDKSVSPPVVRCYDAGGTVVDGEVLARVRGY